MSPLLVTFALFAVTAFVVVRSCVLVQPAHVRIVERLDRFSRTLQPGLHMKLPFLERARAPVDMREKVVALPPNPVIARDDYVLSEATVLHFSVVDPVRATYEVADVDAALEQLSKTTLRTLVGELDKRDALERGPQVATALRGALHSGAEPWGVRINAVDVSIAERPD